MAAPALGGRRPVVLIDACSGSGREDSQQADPSEAPKRFGRFDADKNGVLSRDEFIYMGNVPKR